MLLFEEEDSRATDEDWHAAMIASEVHKSWVKDPSRVKTKDFLLQRGPSKKPAVPLTKEERVAREKAAWSLLIRPAISGRKRKPKKCRPPIKSSKPS